MTHACRFVTTAHLARIVRMDTRTLVARIQAIGVKPDASLDTPNGCRSLYAVERAEEIGRAVLAHINHQPAAA